MKLQDIIKLHCGAIIQCSDNNQLQTVLSIIRGAEIPFKTRYTYLPFEEGKDVWVLNNLREVVALTVEYNEYGDYTPISASDFITSNTPVTAPNEHGDDDYAIPEHIKISA